MGRPRLAGDERPVAEMIRGKRRVISDKGQSPMPATAENLRELHALHQRAKAIRDRLTSGPKTLATRQAVLAARQGALEEARRALKDAKAQAHAKETQLKGSQARSDELRVKLNTIKKQAEYDAIRNQL